MTSAGTFVSVPAGGIVKPLQMCRHARERDETLPFLQHSVADQPNR
jgi:hypothetical protein